MLAFIKLRGFHLALAFADQVEPVEHLVRAVDDVVDDAVDHAVAATKLAWWRKEVADSFAGQPSHPVMKALLPHTTEFGITPAHLAGVIDGCQMDLEQARYLDFPGLAKYCHLVAGIVGEGLYD